jgi:hypothetical protein
VTYNRHMAAKDTEYEKYVRKITEALLRAQGLDHVHVQHNVQVQGLSRSHQVDVYWKYRLGGVDHTVVINAKNYKKTVAVTDVQTLGGVLVDMPGTRGLIVTKKGFQQGAVDYATTHKIGLKVIRPPEDADWDGRLRTIVLNISIDPPELMSCDVKLDYDWIAANLSTDPATLTGRAVANPGLTVVRDLETGIARDMNALWKLCMRQNPTAAGNEGHGAFTWSDARLERPNEPSLKVNSIEFRWKIVKGTEHPVVIKRQHEPEAIVRDAVSGHLLFVDPDGTVSGDTEEEFGSKS